MRAVVDTNILIRAVIKPGGTVGPIVTRLVAADYTLIYSAELLVELLEKLALPRIKHKYHIADADITALVALLALRGELVIPEVRVTVCRDPDDNMVIEAALAGSADCVVTGDEDLLILGTYQEVEFISPRDFLSRLDAEAEATDVDGAPAPPTE
jgi:putative PIN family toxin of toxin-antitoxin system